MVLTVTLVNSVSRWSSGMRVSDAALLPGGPTGVQALRCVSNHVIILSD